uniref:Uncharacterized protein n=1 Tax=Phaseolus vulgaris TaxID=3885 RepID=V7BIU2_PHAVU|nr:hypothetical protein PHAVU_007G276700g [Phaseolus vulgaris]ESW17884.1 hypothetical protein PHAVU_007G276700g [Phaseolus vulgaris]
MAYINAAFRSSREYEVYFFMKDKYVRLYYTPGKSDDKILTNLRLISSGFPSLTASFFAEPGIDCSFDTEESKAYVFSTKYCVYIDYAPGTTNDKILSVFENGIDSAFRSTKGKEVYLFKGNKYTRIDYDSKQLIGSIRNIADGFTILRGTIFESGIDACFCSHKESEAYLFKGEKYVRIKFTPGTSGDRIVGEVRPILDGWTCLRGILPIS